MEEVLTRVAEFGQVVLDYLQQPTFIVQAVVIIMLFAAAWGLAWWADPRLEEKARQKFAC